MQSAAMQSAGTQTVESSQAAMDSPQVEMNATAKGEREADWNDVDLVDEDAEREDDPDVGDIL